MDYFECDGKIMNQKPNVIVGGGIIGLLVAWYLAYSGRPAVIFDRQLVGRESSWAGAGILAPLYAARSAVLTQLAVQSVREYISIVAESDGVSGTNSGLVGSGMFNLDEKYGESGEGEARNYSGKQLEEVEPYLDVSSATLLPDVAQIRSPRFLQSLKTSLSSRGVVLQEHTAITGFRAANGRLRAVESARGTIETNCCVVTAGAWSGQLLRSTGIDVPIKPIRGQMIVLSPAMKYVSHIIVSNHQYLVPRLDGRILVGSTTEDVGFDKSTTLGVATSLRLFALRLVPALRSAPVEHHWAGLRPGSPDDLPFIGEHPDIKGLFVCAGHFRNGFAIGPATARLAVDLMLDRETMIDPTHFRLDRACPSWDKAVRSWT